MILEDTSDFEYVWGKNIVLRRKTRKYAEHNLYTTWQASREKLEGQTEEILNWNIKIAEGYLDRGDFLGAVSDGVLYAGMGVALNFGWGWNNIAQHVENVLMQKAHTARTIVHDVLEKTYSLYQGAIGDDATFVGIYVQKRNPMIFLRSRHWMKIWINMMLIGY